ncbi:DUF2924 domain-containing protein [Roseovarius indicus]|uniref:Bacteriophage-related protein n=1 Tax=Roseovarius indicus TaxID=540747 RepID=A0A0T5PD14_9RHOB|nr:DUF2924 domain-containing protein [Roseovarius indicus]KRS19179.1 bacteriophage-related protein [Roseovarius indicus]QEW25861.1 hypothetical protein RIdsm_01650 [Roseovarius indicus]SFD89466.1 Protein of unknown function [Roseovarius indicus]
MVAVSEIETMDRPQLIALWQDHFGGPPPKSLSRPFLRRTLAFEMQSRAQGGLPKGFVAKLERAAGGDAPKRSTGLQPGGRLLREWNGVTHVVDVTEQGFRWRDQSWRSLSAIAREITGAHWSGPRFFGLNGRAGG